MKSVRTTSPSAAEKRVQRTFVSGAYHRSLRKSPPGAIEKRPAAGSRIAPNKDGLSNRGQQSQSSEPPREMRAADRESPTTA